MRISDWSSDVCSSDLQLIAPAVVLDFSAECAVDPDFLLRDAHIEDWEAKHGRISAGSWVLFRTDWSTRDVDGYTNRRSEEQTSELQSLMRNSYAVFCLTIKTQHDRRRRHEEDARLSMQCVE